MGQCCRHHLRALPFPSQLNMRLLLITQKLDQDDDILGFMHGWVTTLASKVEHVTVICLYKGSVDVPANVTVYSLGKEERRSRTQYLRRFFGALWRARGTYDTVLVHMNVEYILLAGWLWRLTGKRVFLWYNHAMGGKRLRIASWFTHRVFHTSPHAYSARFTHAMRMPVGVDTHLFRPDADTHADPSSILCIGRIAPIKQLEVLVEAISILKDRDIKCTLDIYGSAQVQDIAYYRHLREQAKPLENAGYVKFNGSVANRLTPPLFQSHAIVANMSPDGLYDKTIIEGIASGCMVLVANTAMRDILPPVSLFKKGDAQDMANKLEQILALSPEARKRHTTQTRATIEATESLDCLLRKLLDAMTPMKK